MSNPHIEKTCHHMSDEELIRALTLERDSYSDEFIQIAKMELLSRGIDLDTPETEIGVSHNGASPVTVPLEKAVELIDGQINVWDVWEFIRSFGEKLAVQREELHWVTHHFVDGQYQKSFFTYDNESLKTIVGQFVAHEEWLQQVEHAFQLSDWHILETSESVEYIAHIARLIQMQEIPYVVKARDLWRGDPIFGGQVNESSIHLLVAPASIHNAREVISELNKTVHGLQLWANAFSESSEPEKELEIYDQLAKLTPYDGVIYFNRGIILYELDRYEPAAESFILAVERVGADQALRADLLTYLVETTRQLPEHTGVLHATADLMLRSGQSINARNIFESITRIDDHDIIAHQNLGQMYFQLGDDESKALHHLNRVLELDPFSAERASIEQMISTISE